MIVECRIMEFYLFGGSGSFSSEPLHELSIHLQRIQTLAKASYKKNNTGSYNFLANRPKSPLLL